MIQQNLKKEILGENNLRADSNRLFFAQNRLFTVNVCGSPGAGKTTLISSLCSELADNVPVGVVEGDIASDLDTEMLKKMGINAVQINTGGGCHLTALQVYKGICDLKITNGIVFIENIGNLVCPAAFDLGENCRIAAVSVPEGADKPYKYITMFAAAHMAVLTKYDLAELLHFDTDYFERGLRSVMPSFELYKTGMCCGSEIAALASRLLKLYNENN